MRQLSISRGTHRCIERFQSIPDKGPTAVEFVIQPMIFKVLPWNISRSTGSIIEQPSFTWGLNIKGQQQGLPYLYRGDMSPMVPIRWAFYVGIEWRKFQR